MSLMNLKSMQLNLREKIHKLEIDSKDLNEQYGKVLKEKTDLEEKFEKITKEVKKNAEIENVILNQKLVTLQNQLDIKEN